MLWPISEMEIMNYFVYFVTILALGSSRAVHNMLIIGRDCIPKLYRNLFLGAVHGAANTSHQTWAGQRSVLRSGLKFLWFFWWILWGWRYSADCVCCACDFESLWQSHKLSCLLADEVDVYKGIFKAVCGSLGWLAQVEGLSDAVWVHVVGL